MARPRKSKPDDDEEQLETEELDTEEELESMPGGRQGAVIEDDDDDEAPSALDELAALGMFDPFDDEAPGDINAVIYGPPGSGKTSLALTAPNPILFDFERGGRASALAVNNRAARIIPVREIEQLRKGYRVLKRGGHGFKTVILDPIGELQEIMMQSTVSTYSARRQYDNLPTQTDWNKMLTDLRRLITAFRSIDNMHTILVAHSDAPEHEDDVVKPLASGKNFKPFLMGAMDLLAYLSIVEDEDGETTRRLRTSGSATIAAKNRGGKLPTLIDDPNMTEIIKMMGGRV